MKLLNMLKNVDKPQTHHHESIQQYLSLLAHESPRILKKEMDTVEDSTGKTPLHYAIESENIHIVRLMLNFDNNKQRLEDLTQLIHTKSPTNERITLRIRNRIQQLTTLYEDLYFALHQMVRIIDKSEITLLSALSKYDTNANIIIGHSPQHVHSWIRKLTHNKVSPCPIFNEDEEDTYLMPHMYKEPNNTSLWCAMPIFSLKNVFLNSILSYASKKILIQSIDRLKSIIVYVDTDTINNLCNLKKLLIQAGEYLIDGIAHEEHYIFILERTDSDAKENFMNNIKKLQNRYVELAIPVQREAYAIAAILKLFPKSAKDLKKIYIYTHNNIQEIQKHLQKNLPHLSQPLLISWQPLDVTGLIEHIKDLIVLERITLKNTNIFNNPNSRLYQEIQDKTQQLVERKKEILSYLEHIIKHYQETQTFNHPNTLDPLELTTPQRSISILKSIYEIMDSPPPENTSHVRKKDLVCSN